MTEFVCYSKIGKGYTINDAPDYLPIHLSQVHLKYIGTVELTDSHFFLTRENFLIKISASYRPLICLEEMQLKFCYVVTCNIQSQERYRVSNNSYIYTNSKYALSLEVREMFVNRVIGKGT